MKSVIVIPSNEKRLREIATSLKNKLENHSKLKPVKIIYLDDVNSPEIIENNDIILFGTPTVKNDIYWPIQVMVDSYIHKMQKSHLKSKIFSAFTTTKNPDESCRCLGALLWTFNETPAKILESLCLLDGESEQQVSTKIDTYVKKLFQIVA